MNYCACEIRDLLYYAKVIQAKQTKILFAYASFYKYLWGRKWGSTYRLTTNTTAYHVNLLNDRYFFREGRYGP